MSAASTIALHIMGQWSATTGPWDEAKRKQSACGGARMLGEGQGCRHSKHLVPKQEGGAGTHTEAGRAGDCR